MIAFKTFATWELGSEDGTKNEGDCGKGDDASKGRKIVMRGQWG
jgi:hypothetical protein